MTDRMNETANEPLRFQPGGALRSRAYYVTRPADAEVMRRLLLGESCHVLAPTGSGKSSLLARTQQRLDERSIRTTWVSLGLLTAAKTEEQFFCSLAALVAEEGRLTTDVEAFWDRHPATSHVDRWKQFVLREVLPSIEGPLVVFIDQANAALDPRFPATDFFASLRWFHDMRAEDTACTRLSFCLAGRATEDVLMTVQPRSLFAVSQAVALEDFTPEQAAVFLPGLAGVGDALALLHAVLEWTEGHPYMTHRLCARLAYEGFQGENRPDAVVERLVPQVFLNKGRMDASVLSDAESYLSRNNSPLTRMDALRIYERLLRAEQIPSDPDCQAAAYLRMAGVAANRRMGDGRRVLRVRNRIFATAFDQQWLDRAGNKYGGA